MEKRRRDEERCEGTTKDKQFHEDGVSFQGRHEYKADYANVQETFSKGPIEANGVKYEGDLVNNVPTGHGTLAWRDGSTYTGEVLRGIRHGLGTYQCAKEGVSYTGQWHHGKRHGKGTVFYNKDRTSWYKGDWVMNRIEGWGQRRYPSGNTYTGEWRNNLKHGEGRMIWITLGQEYAGNWQNGVQNGYGTQTWLVNAKEGAEYVRDNQYEGDFLEGRRQGKGTFYYAGGAIYTGEWRNDKKHGKGKLTTKMERVFECEFDDDVMIACLDENGAPPAFGGFPLLDYDPSIPVSDMDVNIDCILKKIPNRDSKTESELVRVVLLEKRTELKHIYRFYARLGHSSPPDDFVLMSCLQFWRFLKDCNIHHHGFTLKQIDSFIREEEGLAETCSPFTTMQLWKFLKWLVLVSYYIYGKDLLSKKHRLRDCISKMLMDDVLPNAMNVKGLLFRQPELTVEALKYANRCWEIFEKFCRIYSAPGANKSMTCRQLLRMFKDLRLYDHQLTTTKLLELISAENPDCSSQFQHFEFEVVFLEFFEVLLGCAELKSQQGSDTPGQCQDQNTSKCPNEEKSPGKEEDSTNKYSLGEMRSDELKIEEVKKLQLTENFKEQDDLKTNETGAKEHQVKSRILTVQEFLNSCFLPAMDH
ncbi:PREDICTED: radial spoke head 10 homolog B-like [Cyprinodon variegatus]|uniref:radial spoke head 10 homolog B-like n=1 Tax=Cyprinodon variegatus TaxID=28743 RepID=UPI0007426373|nr:PREDICTED: radial spoke head 10 homolog B-like [Cyprinodon variegatus]